MAGILNFNFFKDQVIFRSVVRHGSESERDNRPDSGFDSNRDVEERYDEAGAGHGDHGHSVSLPGLATQESVSANINQIVDDSQNKVSQNLPPPLEFDLIVKHC